MSVRPRHRKSSRTKARVQRELRQLDSTLPVLNMETIDESLEDLVSQDRLLSALAGFFGIVAAALACLGLYGVISYATARRTNEIGIRLALGATRIGVLKMVLYESLWLAVVGVVLGIPAALAVLRAIAATLFGASTTTPLAIGGAALLLLAVASCAGFVPARRAASVDPMTALRYE
jgi:ABC-type antimicrobial peptide transport system permease subunit